MELALIVSTVFRRYEFELYQKTMETREGFLRKPLGLMVGMRRRKSSWTSWTGVHNATACCNMYIRSTSCRHAKSCKITY